MNTVPERVVSLKFDCKEQTTDSVRSTETVTNVHALRFVNTIRQNHQILQIYGDKIIRCLPKTRPVVPGRQHKYNTNKSTIER
jgi:hypothetical protein